MRKIILIACLIIPSFVFSQNSKIGVYYQSGNDTIKIKPISSSGYKTNTLGAALTMGIASSNMTVKFKHSKSENQIDNPRFVFFFQDMMPVNVSSTYFNFVGTNSPGNFTLVKLKSKRKNRELDWGKVNAYSGIDIGTKDGDMMPFTFEEVDMNIYKVTPIVPLDKGEYAFVFDGLNGSGAFMPIFDFSIR